MLTLALTAAALLATNPCTLVTKAEAVTVTGKAPSTILPYGPETEPETKSSVQWCVYGGGGVGLIVYLDTFASPAAAVGTMTRERIIAVMDDETKVEPEPGLGDKAFWAVNESGGRIVVIRGATVLSLVFGGVEKDPAAKRAAVRALAVAALKRM